MEHNTQNSLKAPSQILINNGLKAKGDTKHKDMNLILRLYFICE
jgi:hypothetical protein